MAIHGKNTGLTVAQYDLTRWFKQVQLSSSVDTAESTAFQNPGGAKSYVMGSRDATAELQGMFDAQTAPQKDIASIFDDIVNIDDIVPVMFAVGSGFSVGGLCNLGDADATALQVTAPVADVVSTSASFQFSGGVRQGRSLLPSAALSATANQAAVDNAAASSTGGFAILSVDPRAAFGGGGTGSAVFKVQHSTDNSTWTDLVTFNAIVGNVGGYQIVNLAALATVNRYVRGALTLTGAGPILARMGLSRLP